MQRQFKDLTRVYIGAMGDDQFERFMSDLLPCVYPGFDRLEPSFNFIGKTTKGKCDAHVYHAGDDTYTAIICTTQQSVIRTKVLEDIDKLTSTKFAKKIRRVVVCANTAFKDEVEEYREACAQHGWELDPFTLERINNSIVAQPDLLRRYFPDLPYDNSDAESTHSTRRFDCGERLKVAREDILLPASQLIEIIDFPSEREWKAVESGQIEISEKYIDRLSTLTGISPLWLKHDDRQKYPSESLFDFQSERISAIASAAPIAVYMVIEPTSMDTLLVLKFSNYNAKVWSFQYSMNFWEWTGDELHIPVIYNLLKTINKSFPHIQGRIISRSLMADFHAGLKHPLQLLKTAGNNSYWFDDLFDLHHTLPIASNSYKHYGEWFIKLQDSFRHHVRQASTGPAPI